MAASLVRAHAKGGAKKDTFLIDKRLAEKYPGDYVVVDKDPEIPTNEVGMPVAAPEPEPEPKPRAKKPATDTA